MHILKYSGATHACLNQPKKWTLKGVISVGVSATLHGVTIRISNPKWRDKPKSYPKWRIRQNPIP